MMSEVTINDCIDAVHSALAEENQRLREALKPFDQMAGEVFALNYNNGDVVFALHGTNARLTARDFFAVRRATAPTRHADADPDISGVPV